MALLPSDGALIPAAGRAEEAAKEALPAASTLVRDHAAFVGRALRYLGVREADLEDTAQEVFLTVVRRMGDFEGRSSIRTWIYGICLRTAQNQRRKASNRREQPVAEPPETAAAADQDASLARAEARRTLQTVLDALDEAKRTVFVLYEIEQLSMKEVAEAVGCPLQTAYSRHQAARAAVTAAFERLRRKEEP